MKQIHQLLPPRSLAILGCLLALCGGLGRAQTQTPIAEPMDVFYGETKQLPLDRPIDDFSVTPLIIVPTSGVSSAKTWFQHTGILGAR